MTQSARYRALVYLTLLLSFLVVVWGGIVRVTGSGLGCPDWPLCHGQFLPGLDTATRIEWFHRFIAIAGGLSLATLGVITIARYRAQRRVLALVVAAGMLYIFQAVLGGIVVLLELPHTWVTAHLANAEILLAVLTVLAVEVPGRGSRRASAPRPGALPCGGRRIFAAAIRAYVRGADASTACTTWPFCDDARSRRSARKRCTWRTLGRRRRGLVLLAACWQRGGIAVKFRPRHLAVLTAVAFAAQVVSELRPALRFSPWRSALIRPSSLVWCLTVR